MSKGLAPGDEAQADEAQADEAKDAANPSSAASRPIREVKYVQNIGRFEKGPVGFRGNIRTGHACIWRERLGEIAVSGSPAVANHE